MIRVAETSNCAHCDAPLVWMRQGYASYWHSERWPYCLDPMGHQAWLDNGFTRTLLPLRDDEPAKTLPTEHPFPERTGVVWG